MGAAEEDDAHVGRQAAWLLVISLAGVVLVAFVLSRLVAGGARNLEPFSRLAHEIEELPVPESMTLVKEHEEGRGYPFFGENPTVVHTYGTRLDITEACLAAEELVAEWGTVSVVQPPEGLTGGTDECLVQGVSTDVDDHTTIRVIAYEPNRYQSLMQIADPDEYEIDIDPEWSSIVRIELIATGPE